MRQGTKNRAVLRWGHGTMKRKLAPLHNHCRYAWIEKWAPFDDKSLGFLFSARRFLLHWPPRDYIGIKQATSVFYSVTIVYMMVEERARNGPGGRYVNRSIRQETLGPPPCVPSKSTLILLNANMLISSTIIFICDWRHIIINHNFSPICTFAGPLLLLPRANCVPIWGKFASPVFSQSHRYIIHELWCILSSYDKLNVPRK